MAKDILENITFMVLKHMKGILSMELKKALAKIFRKVKSNMKAFLKTEKEKLRGWNIIPMEGRNMKGDI